MTPRPPPPRPAPTCPPLRGGFPLGPSELRAEIEPKQGQRKYRLTHVFAPITAADWMEFERLSQVVMEARPGEETFTTDSLSAEAAEWLWAERIKEVVGYTGLREAAGTEQTWKEQIPFSYKEAALVALSQVGPAQAAELTEGFALDAAEETVRLEAVRNGEVYENLVHRLRLPSTAQRKEHSRRQGRSTYVRGTQKGNLKALLASNTAYLIELYDDLIKAIEGYDSDDPVKMDPLHKKAAVEVLLGNG